MTMSSEFDNLSRAIERDARLLDVLPEVAPSATGLERVRAAVAAEARDIGLRRRRFAALRLWGGVAAALLLAVGLTWMQPATSGFNGSDPDELVGEWAEAWEESTQSLTGLLDGGWIYGDFGEDDETLLDDYFDSLDQSLQKLESL
jgi:hypothetical protein